MATVTARSIISKAQIIIQDLTSVRWPTAELLGWLNEGQRAILIVKPNANVKNTSIRLVAGTKQDIPADGIQLVDVTRNMGTDGLTAGRSIRITAREVLDSQLPDWHTSTASAVVQHFMYRALDPKHFYNYPPQPATNTGYVEIVYGAIPAVAAIDDVISLDDIYESVLMDYLLYRAFSKDSSAADAARAQRHQAAYFSALTGKMAVESVVNPNKTAAGNPNVVATA